MLPFLLSFLVLALIGAGIFFIHAHRRNVARIRLADDTGSADREEWEGRIRGSILERHRWVAVVIGLAAVAVLALVLGLAFWLAFACAFVIGAVAWIVEDFLASRKELIVEEQCADAIDLVVSALRAGASLVDALRIASQESRRPLKPALEELVRRLELGDDPDAVFHDFSLRVPVETASVLAFSMQVHWRVGGGLARALATVAQSARHRIEFTRRVKSQATEGRASLIGMMAITYLLTLLLWRAYPERFEGFFRSSIGIGLTTMVMVLQGIGLMWTTALTRTKP